MGSVILKDHNKWLRKDGYQRKGSFGYGIKDIVDEKVIQRGFATFSDIEDIS